MKRRKTRAQHLTSSALFVASISLLFAAMFTLVRRFIFLTKAEEMLLSLLEEILVYLLPAYFGLYFLTGDRFKTIRIRRIENVKMAYLFLAGVFILFPVMLVRSFESVLKLRLGFTTAMPTEAGESPFFPALLLYVGLRPAAASLFYDGFLSDAFVGQNKWFRMLPLLLFVLQHGATEGVIPSLMTGLLLLGLYDQSMSILAPFLFYAGIGFSRLVFERMESLYLLNMQGMPASAFLLIASCLCLVWVCRLYKIPAEEVNMKIPGRVTLSKKEQWMIAASAMLAVSAVVLSEVLG